MAARFKDIDPTVKALMPPMLLLTPVLWKPEMLGEFSYFIYFNPFTYFVSVIRNDLIGLSFDIYLAWNDFITMLNLVIFVALYHKKRNRIILDIDMECNIKLNEVCLDFPIYDSDLYLLEMRLKTIPGLLMTQDQLLIKMG